MAEVLKELERITPQEEEPATEESFAVFHPQPREIPELHVTEMSSL